MTRWIPADHSFCLVLLLLSKSKEAKGPCPFFSWKMDSNHFFRFCKYIIPIILFQLIQHWITNKVRTLTRMERLLNRRVYQFHNFVDFPNKRQTQGKMFSKCYFCKAKPAVNNRTQRCLWILFVSSLGGFCLEFKIQKVKWIWIRLQFRPKDLNFYRFFHGCWQKVKQFLVMLKPTYGFHIHISSIELRL
jgi:hypothetical protein